MEWSPDERANLYRHLYNLDHYTNLNLKYKEHHKLLLDHNFVDYQNFENICKNYFGKWSDKDRQIILNTCVKLVKADGELTEQEKNNIKILSGFLPPFKYFWTFLFILIMNGFAFLFVEKVLP